MSCYSDPLALHGRGDCGIDPLLRDQKEFLIEASNQSNLRRQSREQGESTATDLR